MRNRLYFITTTAMCYCTLTQLDHCTLIQHVGWTYECNALTYNTTNRLSYNTTYISNTYVLHLYYITTRTYAFLLYTITTKSCNVIQPHPVRKNRFRSRACARMCIIDPLHTVFPSFLKLGTMFSSFLILAL